MSRILLWSPLTALLLWALGCAFVNAHESAPARDLPPLPRHRPTAKPDTVPRNVILMISDGCGQAAIDAASLYRHGATGQLACEGLPLKLWMSTYPRGGGYDAERVWLSRANMIAGATDSAAAATAMSTGVKTSNGRLGTDPGGAPLKHAFEWAEERGKSTGVVTTVPFSHATPAGFAVHDSDRQDYAQIARSMLQDSALDVVIGCGNPQFNNDGRPTEMGYKLCGGADTWRAAARGTLGGDADGDGVVDAWTLLQTRAEFQALARQSLAGRPGPARLLGVPQAYDTLQQKRRGDPNAAPYAVPLNAAEPTLAELSLAALGTLGNDGDGFMLMIEGGAVDWAAHAHQPGRLIEEELDFDAAVTAVRDWIKARSSDAETMLLVTADHETGLISGPDNGAEVITPLSGAGPAVLQSIHWHTGGHSNQLVPLFASGAGSALLTARVLGTDPVRGVYLDNTGLGQVLVELAQH